MGGGTFCHSIIDVFAAYGAYTVLKKAFPWLNAFDESLLLKENKNEKKQIEIPDLKNQEI